MEVAESQWRRQWAGTAEYGKVVEGGVTRRVARAMEVLHASAPGTKVRVMRAAYHSSAGPGLPASSYMMHASRRVFSSGFNFLEQPPSPTKPLEISSIPFDSTPDSHIDIDTENYKVTEPDDFEISEPSKWISSKSGSMRMPSEESSSTDNASIIDLDPKIYHKNILRKYSCDSENSDITHSGRNSRVSPLLDTPVTLSTLKYKSLLNGSNDWNSRRKSYSFEDTSPLSDSIFHSNDTLAMESSTDSGICKSTEIVNDHVDDNMHSRYFGSKERDMNKQDDSFQSWLSKNRQNNNYYKGPKFKSYREHQVVKEDPAENNITLQSTGKVSIALPVKVETDDGYHYQKNDISEDGQRKIKKVEFCKTELHFAVDTGKVNIIATDEKPPPTNDFRKRRSAFVPMHEMIEKPITLFGEKVDNFPDITHKVENLKHYFSETNESDENTAATKSILKNKIPKPKPYLLGENMAFGSEDILRDGNVNNASKVLTAVSLINRQLQTDKRCDNEMAADIIRNDSVSVKNDAFRTTTQGPPKSSTPTTDIYGFRAVKNEKVVKIHEEHKSVNSSKDVRSVKRSPTPGRLKTRELRESDLTYFGIDSQPNVMSKSYNRQLSIDDSDQDEFQSVKLIRRVSSSACNSESEDAPEYMNIPFNTDFAPVPTPRIRSKYDDKPNQIDEINVLKPIIEHVRDVKNEEMVTTRRSKLRKHDEISFTSRSISEPRKSNKFNSAEKPNRLFYQPTRCLRDKTIKQNVDQSTTPSFRVATRRYTTPDDASPMYVNLNKSGISNVSKHVSKMDSLTNKNKQKENQTKKDTTVQRNRKLETPPSSLGRSTDKAVARKPIQCNETTDTLENESKTSIESGKVRKLNNSSRKTDKEFEKTKKIDDSIERKHSHNHNTDSKIRHEHKSRTTERKAPKDVAKDIIVRDSSSTARKKNKSHENTSTGESLVKNNDTKLRKLHTSKDKTITGLEAVEIIPKAENSTIDKSTASRDVRHRHGSKSKKSEYVINYDDKNGTVSSVQKLSLGSDSSRRKKTSKEVVKEKFKENSKHKTTDKAALLQTEDHHRNFNTIYEERRRRSKVHVQRSCQML